MERVDNTMNFEDNAKLQKIEYGAYYRTNRTGEIIIPIENTDYHDKIYVISVFNNYFKDDGIKIENRVNADEYVSITSLQELQLVNLKNLIIDKDNKIIRLSPKEWNKIKYAIWEYQLEQLKRIYIENDENIRFSSWINRKYRISYLVKQNHRINIDNNGKLIILNKNIYWAEMGHNIGSELRKLRPVIIWKHCGDLGYIVIPITSSNKISKFRVPLTCLAGKYAVLEHMKYISFKRIKSPLISNMNGKEVKVSIEETEKIKEKLRDFLNLY